MTSECHDGDCPHHSTHFGGEGPFCDEPECLKPGVFPQSLRDLGYTEEELELDNPYNTKETSMKLTPTEIKNALLYYTGSTSYTRFSGLFRNFVLTDGALFLAENANSYWLMDAIASHKGSYKNERFVVATLSKRGTGWVLNLVDDLPATKTFATQKITYSDFPLDEIKLYVIPQDDLWVIMLPSEY